MKQFGHFDDAHREYVITDPATPWPWINYMGTEDFFSLISNTAGGYCFCKDAKFRRILRYRYNGVPMDDGGRYYYIKDGDTVWNPGWKPCKTPLDSYECRHGMGYTRVTGEKDGLKADVLFFVPIGHRCEVHRVRLTNTGDKPKSFQFYSFVEWCLWNASTDMENFQRNLSTGQVEIEGNVLYHKTEYRERRDHYAFFGVNRAFDGFDTDRETFIGMYNGFNAPQQVFAGTSGNSVAHGWSPVASHRFDLTLEPGETEELILDVQGRGEIDIGPVLMDLFTHGLAHVLHQLLVPGRCQQGADGEVRAVVRVIVAFAGRVDAESGRAVGEDDGRNAQAFDGIGSAGGTRDDVLRRAHDGGFTTEAGHAGADDEMDLFLEGHGLEDFVD